MKLGGTLGAGQDALARASWQEARDLFEAAVAEDPTPESLEGLGMAAYWLDDEKATFESRHEAFRLYRERGDVEAAARIAIRLSEDYLLFRGEDAVARGWLLRAERLLTDAEPCPEHARLLVYKAHYTMPSDPVAAGEIATQAAEVARSLGQFDLEMVALAVGGVAKVYEGAVADGLTSLDEATAAATGGEMTDLELIPWTCCYLVGTCEIVRDYERATQWIDIVRTMARRWEMRIYLATCMPSYVTVLISRGRWAEAEEELTAGRELIRSTRRGLLPEATLRLAELRRRQGRLDEARQLLVEHEHDQNAMLILAEMALDRGDGAEAVALAERVLRLTPPTRRSDLANCYEVLVRARLTSGDVAGAAEASSSLTELAGLFGTSALLASAKHADGIVAAASDDRERARAALEEAVYLFEREGIPFEAARAHGDLARALDALGDEQQADRARKRRRELLAGLGVEEQAPRRALTKRETEVLRLVADGKTDREVARELSLSEHTIHRHVANIMTKLGASSRSAAVASAAKQGLI